MNWLQLFQVGATVFFGGLAVLFGLYVLEAELDMIDADPMLVRVTCYATSGGFVAAVIGGTAHLVGL